MTPRILILAGLVYAVLAIRTDPAYMGFAAVLLVAGAALGAAGRD